MEKPTLQNKVFTENPLLDEIVYNARQLAIGTVLKDYDRANNAETLESIKAGDIYIAVCKGIVKFDYFNYTYDMLKAVGFSDEEAHRYEANNSLIPESARSKLLSMASEDYINNYVEYNDYYRMLHGIPKYDSTYQWNGLYLDVNYINPSVPTSIEHISPTYLYFLDENLTAKQGYPVYSDYRPIHDINEMTISNILLLQENGTIDNILNSESIISSWGLEKEDIEYLKFIGDKSIDYYDARVADRFEMLYCPSCDSEEVKTRYKDLLEANRLYLLYTIYSEAYKYRSDYYDNFMMIFIVIQTIIDMIIELPEYIIRRDIFDTRTCKYIFESNGVKYFNDIPLKYQVALVKNLNKLIKFKSTDKCIVDIISIFGMDNIKAFKYYILRDREVNGVEFLKYLDATTEEGKEDTDQNYDLKFIKVPLQSGYDDHIRTETSLYDYSSVVDGDGYWIGDKDYDTVRKAIKDVDFTVLRSKYYSIEAVVDLTKRNFTLVYFMNILMYNHIDKSQLKVNMPNISVKKKFELVDIILTLYALGYIYYGVEDSIMDSRNKVAQILGFNMETDMAKIAEYIWEHHRETFRHDPPTYDPEEYKSQVLSKFGVADFIVPSQDTIYTFNELENIYFTNRDIYNHVREVLLDPPTKELYDVYNYIYKSLFIMNCNMEYFLIGGVDVVNRYKSLGYKLKFITVPKREDYTTEEQFIQEWEWFIESLDHETLYLVMDDDFDENHIMVPYLLNEEGTDIEKQETTSDIVMASTITQFLGTKDASIYSFLQNIINIQAADVRQEQCVNAIQAITSYLKDYITQTNLENPENVIDLNDVFSGLPSVSLDFVRNYVSEVVDYFKSFKIFTHGASLMYVFDDKFENYVHLIDRAFFWYLLDKSELVKIEDAIGAPIQKIADRLLHVGPGIKPDMTKEDRAIMLDKLWLEIDTWINKSYDEIYNAWNDKSLLKYYCPNCGKEVEEDTEFCPYCDFAHERSIKDTKIIKSPIDRIKDNYEIWSKFEFDDKSIPERMQIDCIIEILNTMLLGFDENLFNITFNYGSRKCKYISDSIIDVPDMMESLYLLGNIEDVSSSNEELLEVNRESVFSITRDKDFDSEAFITIASNVDGEIIINDIPVVPISSGGVTRAMIFYNGQYSYRTSDRIVYVEDLMPNLGLHGDPVVVSTSIPDTLIISEDNIKWSIIPKQIFYDEEHISIIATKKNADDEIITVEYVVKVTASRVPEAVRILEQTAMHNTHEFEEHYEEWISDLRDIIITLEYTDYLRIMDDRTLTSTYNFNNFIKLLEKITKHGTDISLYDSYRPADYCNIIETRG